MFVKKVIFTVIVCLLVGTYMGGNVVQTMAQEYSDEEKAEAKAWLSAHGYSPTKAGAEQAYQDYLAGKFDEELKTNSELAATEEEAIARTKNVTTTENITTENGVDMNGESSESGQGIGISGGKTTTELTSEVIESTTEQVKKEESKVQPKVAPINNEPQKETKEKAWKLILSVAIIALLVLVGIIIFIYKKSKKKE